MNVKSFIDSLFNDDFQEKDVELLVNGLTKRLSPELQTRLIVSLIEFREREIKETQSHLNRITEDKNKMLVDITALSSITT